MIAPAPAKSSRHGRSVPSSHLSPAGMTAMFLPFLIADSATARQFLKQPAIIVAELVAKLSEEPFGDGSTSRTPCATAVNDAGDSEYPRSLFLSATSALIDSANR